MIEEYKKLALSWVMIFIIMGAIFYKSGIFAAFRFSAALFLVLILPGFSLLYKREFLERLVFGFILSIAVIGVPSYYIALLGLHIKYHFILPVIITVIGIGLDLKRGDENGISSESQKDT